MDRQLLLCLGFIGLIFAGCSGDRSPPPAEAVTYQQKTTYDFPDDHVSGDLLRPNGSETEQSPVPTIPAVPEGLEGIRGPGFGELAGGGGGFAPPGSGSYSGLGSGGAGGGGTGGGFSINGPGSDPASGAALDSSRNEPSPAEYAEIKREMEQARQREAEESRRRAEFRAQIDAQNAAQAGRQAKSGGEFIPPGGGYSGGRFTPQLPIAPPTTPPTLPSTPAEPQQEIAPGSGLSAEGRRKILDKIEEQSSGVLGALGSKKRDGEQPNVAAASEVHSPAAATSDREMMEAKRALDLAMSRAQAEEARQRANYEAYERARQSASSRQSSGSIGPASQPSLSAEAQYSSADSDRALKEAQRAVKLAQGRLREEEKKWRDLEEKRRSAPGGLSGRPAEASGRSSSLSELGTNSLRGGAPATANPLRTARSESQSAPQPAPPPLSPVAADAPPPPANPSGGAAPPPNADWLAEMERAFAANPSASPGSAAGSPGAEPSAPQSTGPAAPETSPPTTDEPGGSTFRSVAENTAGDSFPTSPAPEVKPFDVVEVFYGTDRQSTDAIPFHLMQLLVAAWPTATMGLITLCVGLAAAGRKSWMLWLVTAVGLAVSLCLGYQASASSLAMVRDAGKEGPRYTTDRATGGRVELGRCEITIPNMHVSGELEAPSILRLEVAENAERHVILSKTERLADERFYELLRESVSHSANRELFVFVHGFNVTFADAARRTAQIHHDLKFDGAPIFFSWPAHDKSILTYPADETNVAWSAPHLKQFLLEIVKESQAKSINLIAHSMGNRALATALREIQLELHDQAMLFNQVILAAPDIDADDFRNNIAPAMQRTAQRLTLYASSSDEALTASKLVHRFPRAGEAGAGLIVIPGMDTIDVTGMDTSLLGHGYIGSSDGVLNDLRAVLSRAIPAGQRGWLSPVEYNGQTYWVFDPRGGGSVGPSMDFSANLAAIVPGAKDSQLQAELFRKKAEDQQQLAALLEDEKLSYLGGLTGGAPAKSPEPAPQSPPAEKSGNPFRVDVAAVPTPITGSGEPRGEPRIPRIPTTAEPRFAPAPTPALPTSAVPTSAVPTFVPPPPNLSSLPKPTPYVPSGGAAMPEGGLAEIERAFSKVQPPPPPKSDMPTDAPDAAPAQPAGPAAPSSSERISLIKEATSSPNAAPAPPPSGPFDVVEVFYGTDRQSGDAPPSDWLHILLCFLPTASVGLMATCLAFVAAGRKSWFLGVIAILGIAVSLGLGYEGVGNALALVRGAGHQGPRYTVAKAPAGRVEVGRCEVTIPKSHKPGEVETPSLLRLEIAPDVAEHLVLYKTQPLADVLFYETLRKRVEQSDRRELFVFVHGFNVSFEDAARRTAQIHYDLKFQGAPIFFSWPANDRFLFTYPADETNVSWSVPHLKQFLLSIVKESQAKSINLIAHSMGNRALAAALREIELEFRDQAKLFNQVILAAPDIDADDFRHNIAPAMQRTAQRLTLYASSRDEALLASQYLHRGARAGAAGDGLIVLPGMDTIDVTPIDRSLWGHAYYGSSNPVLNDLRILLSRAVPPRDRKWLSPAERDGQEYWIFQPARTAEAHGELTR